MNLNAGDLSCHFYFSTFFPIYISNSRFRLYWIHLCFNPISQLRLYFSKQRFIFTFLSVSFDFNSAKYNSQWNHATPIWFQFFLNHLKVSYSQLFLKLNRFLITFLIPDFSVFHFYFSTPILTLNAPNHICNENPFQQLII